jgi:hypothetical protein
MVLLAGVGLTACSGEQPTPSAPVSVATAGAKADVDPASGTVTLPWDRFMMTPKEWDDVVSGLNVALIECVEAAGIASGERPKRVIPDNDSFYGYGVWLMRDAQRYGYVRPESPEKLDALSRAADNAVTQAELDQRARCAQTADDVLALRADRLNTTGPWVAELDAARDAIRKTSAWQQVVADWGACLTGNGAKPDLGAFAASGVDWEAVERYEVREADVKLAILDVACKDKTDFVQRLGDLDASAQAPIISAYRADLQKSRSDLEAVHARAIAVLRRAGL